MCEEPQFTMWSPGSCHSHQKTKSQGLSDELKQNRPFGIITADYGTSGVNASLLANERLNEYVCVHASILAVILFPVATELFSSITASSKTNLVCLMKSLVN